MRLKPLIIMLPPTGKPLGTHAKTWVCRHKLYGLDFPSLLRTMPNAAPSIAPMHIHSAMAVVWSRPPQGVVMGEI